MTVSLWRAFLVLLVVRRSIVAGVNRILGTDCKGAVGRCLADNTMTDPKDKVQFVGNIFHSKKEGCSKKKNNKNPDFPLTSHRTDGGKKSGLIKCP